MPAQFRPFGIVTSGDRADPTQCKPGSFGEKATRVLTQCTGIAIAARPSRECEIPDTAQERVYQLYQPISELSEPGDSPNVLCSK